MKHRIDFVTISLLVLAALSSPVQAVEIINIRSGQVGGAPGACGQNDDCLRYLAAPACALPLSNLPFTAADFLAARTGPAAKVINPLGGIWIPQLPCDSLSRWVNPEPLSCAGQSGGTPLSALYACQFNVQTPGNPTCRLEVCWAVDDGLGDAGDPNPPNPAGIYVNEVPVNISGGNFAAQTTASQSVALLTGANTIYFYQRDRGCVVSGLVVSARFICESAVPAEPATWGSIKSIYR